MSLTTLPEEVLETILLYVNAEDILNVLSVVGSGGSEGFWRKICLQNKYKIILEEGKSWKNNFCRNISWVKGSYLKSEYYISDLSDSGCDSSRNTTVECIREPHPNTLNQSHCFLCPEDVSENKFFLIRNKLLSQKGEVVLVRNVENPQQLLQKMHGVNIDWCNKSRTKLLIRTQSSMVIYSCEKEHCNELMVLNDSPFYPGCYVLTDDYLAVLKTDRKEVTVVNFNVMEEYSLPVSHKKVIPFIVSVCDHILKIVMLDSNDYILRRYHLKSNEWLEDFLLFGGAAMIQVPKVKMNSRVIVSWSSLLEGRGITPLKMWTSNADPSRCTSGFTLLAPNSVVNPENVLWLILAEDYVIYSTSKSSFSILNVSETEQPKTMAMYGNDHLGQNVISGLLVLSYTYCFMLIDFKKVTYLYEVWFDFGLTYMHFCVNEHFYIAFNISCNKDNAHKKLCIYDFRGQKLGGFGLES